MGLGFLLPCVVDFAGNPVLKNLWQDPLPGGTKTGSPQQRYVLLDSQKDLKWK